MSKGKITIIVLVIFMVLAAVIGGVYAYYSNNQKEKTDLAAIIASMEKEINKNVETITHLEQTLELNGLELEDLIEKKVEYQTLIDDRTKTQKEYIERKDYITRTLTDKQTIYQTKVEEKTKIEKEIETLTETLNNTASSETETITEIQEKIVELEKEKVVVETEIQEVEKIIVEYETELVEVEERINVLTININQLNEMITELNVSVNLIGKTEEETRALVKSLEDENAALAEELALAKVEIENLKANAEAKYQNIIDNLNSDISNLQSSLTATENELNSYKEANISLQQTIINLENEIEDLNNNSNTAQVEELLQQIEELNLQIQEYEEFIAADKSLPYFMLRHNTINYNNNGEIEDCVVYYYFSINNFMYHKSIDNYSVSGHYNRLNYNIPKNYSLSNIYFLEDENKIGYVFFESVNYDVEDYRDRKIINVFYDLTGVINADNYYKFFDNYIRSVDIDIINENSIDNVIYRTEEFGDLKLLYVIQVDFLTDIVNDD